jgi:hypothetical protein
MPEVIALNAKNKSDINLFLRVPQQVFSGDKNWVPPLMNDEKALFENNPTLQHGQLALWLVKENNEIAGRIAAFAPTNNSQGAIAWFCATTPACGNALVQTAIGWLKQHHIKTVEAPVNLGERDKFWGWMTAGFQQHSYLENYNTPESADWFSRWGFEPKFKQTTWYINKHLFKADVLKPLSDRIQQRGYRFEKFNRQELTRFAKDFETIYNDAWQQHEHFKPISAERVAELFRDMMPLILDDLIVFAYANEQPIGFYVNMLKADWFFRRAKGKLGWKQQLLFLWFRYVVPKKAIRGVVFGIRQAWQNRGVEAGLIMAINANLSHYPTITESELSWIGDFNPRMLSMLEKVGAIPLKNIPHT